MPFPARAVDAATAVAFLATVALGAAASPSTAASVAPACAPATLNPSAALAGGAVTVSPAPDTLDASFLTQISFLGVPSTDISSDGPYGVYHSVFDNFAWFKKFGDTNFLYSQEIARVMGLEVLRMSEAAVLPFDYEVYAKEISNYLDAAQKKASATLGDKAPKFDGASAGLLGGADCSRNVGLGKSRRSAAHAAATCRPSG